MSQTDVLLIDDDREFVAVTGRRLSRRNMTVFAAHSGAAGLRILNREPQIDVVILDLKMPVVDGITTLKAMKRAYPGVEVIVLTGHATMQSAEEAMNHGAFGLLTKPCDIDDLVTIIAEARANKAQREDTGAVAGP
jgi:DNA-binding NtrC family response regulator